MTTRGSFKIAMSSLFIVASIGFAFALQALLSIAINSFRNVMLFIPILLTCGTLIYLLFAINMMSKKDKDKILHHSFVHGLITLGISFISLILLVIYYFTLLKGKPVGDIFTFLYPIDFIIFDSIIIVLSALFLFFRKRILKSSDDFKIEKVKKNIVFTIFLTIYFVLAAYFFGLFFFGFFIMDSTHPGNSLGIIAVMLMCVLPAVMVLTYYAYYDEKRGDERILAQFRLTLIFTIIALILLIMYVIQKGINPQFVVESIQGMFPLSFAISIKIAIALLFILNFAPCFVSLFNMLYKKHQRKKQSGAEDKEVIE